MKKNHIDIISFTRSQKDSFKKLSDWYKFLKVLNHKFEPHQLKTLQLLGNETPLELAMLLGASISGLEEQVNFPEYKTFLLPKKRGGYRIINEPGQKLKRIQQRLNIFLQAYFLCIKPPFVHGFVINPYHSKAQCNIVENAREHAGKRHLLNIDLVDFFPQISSRRVKELFLSEYFQFNENLANFLTLLLTYQGSLPVGAPTSPAVSNFVCLWLDANLNEFCSQNQIRYTRYADDLTFSADNPFTKRIISGISDIIVAYGFRVNHQKTRLSGSNRKQVVTGLIVNTKVNVDRRYIKKTRAMLHDCLEHGSTMAAYSHFGIPGKKSEKELTSRFVNSLNGRISFIGQVRGRDDPTYLKFNEEFRRVFRTIEC